jgi:hypothetical protein
LGRRRYVVVIAVGPGALRLPLRKPGSFRCTAPLPVAVPPGESPPD